MNIDALDLLTEKTTQLSSMLMVISGGGFENFDSFGEDVKQNYLWACAGLAEDVEKLSTRLAIGDKKNN